jgi:NAD+ diphosphatase
MYCSICGNKLIVKPVDKEGDIPYCGQCDKLFFPQINLAMIAILTNSKNQICLVNQNSLSKFKVLIAGYIKPGENLENCVRREIKEEIGVDIENCEYMSSHYYENNNVLMTGFHATTNQSDLKIDDTEIDSANWYELDDALWRIREGSIAYKLVDQFIKSK